MKFRLSDTAKSILFTLLGFLLAMAWDVYKAHRESEQREHVTIAAFKEEMVANRAIAENNSRNRSREEYRLNNSGHAAYQRRLKIYDSHLIEWEELLLKQVKELEAPIK